MTTPEKSCRSKNRYSDQATAFAAAARCYQVRGHWLRVYACEECKGYHLTHLGALPPVDARWRPPERPARDRKHPSELENREWRRRRGGKTTARRYGK